MAAEQTRTYETLKLLGHTPAKTVEIMLDAKRGDKHALGWVDMALQMLRAQPTL